MISLVFLPFLISLVVLSFLFKRGSKALIRASFLIYLFVIFLFLSLEVLNASLTYFAFKKNPISRFLLPPFSDWEYFLSYIYFHYFRIFFLNLVLSLIMVVVLRFFNKVFKKRLFFEEEIYFAGIAFMSTKFPLNIFLMFLVITLGIFVAFLKKIFKILKNKKFSFYTSLYWFWLISSIFLIIFEKFILKLPILKELII